MRRVKVSINADHPEGRGLCGNAFRVRQACIANDLRADPRGSAFHQFIHSDGAMSGAAFPLLVSGEPVGVMFFISSEKETFTSNSPSCCSGSPTTSRSRSRPSTGPTRRRGPKVRKSV
jgi:putative methionine-R-sulfoxide reductase with GAF domain